MRRSIRGHGSADYTPEEEHFVRGLIADGAHEEVLVIHELKVLLDAAPTEETAKRMRERMAADVAARQGTLT